MSWIANRPRRLAKLFFMDPTERQGVAFKLFDIHLHDVSQFRNDPAQLLDSSRDRIVGSIKKEHRGSRPLRSVRSMERGVLRPVPRFQPAYILDLIA
jgi:hypothetical protein